MTSSISTRQQRAMKPSGESIESLYTFMTQKFKDLEEKVATKECISSLHQVICDQNTKISQLEDNIAVLERHVIQLQRKSEENEQYQRRLCLRINGIEVPQAAESADECLEKVRDVFKELKVSVPDNVIDRAHRVGPTRRVNGKPTRQMIVRLTTWRHRTAIYRARKTSDKYKIKLDLTKTRVKLLEEANQILKGKGNCFAFCDINCRPTMFHDGSYHFFNCLKDVEKYLNKEETVAVEEELFTRFSDAGKKLDN